MSYPIDHRSTVCVSSLPRDNRSIYRDIAGGVDRQIESLYKPGLYLLSLEDEESIPEEDAQAMPVVKELIQQKWLRFTSEQKKELKAFDPYTGNPILPEGFSLTKTMDLSTTAEPVLRQRDD